MTGPPVPGVNAWEGAGMKPLLLALLVSLDAVTGASTAGCSPTQRNGLTAPTAITEPALSNGIASGLLHAAAFPPRNEPFLFRTNLESKYRDGLHREATSSYVDIEGTVVWTQEYLRYRVSQCGHAAAVAKVLRQIDGFAAEPECNAASTSAFPPRNEPLDFRVQLEQKYRDGLGRAPTMTFVDPEGRHRLDARILSLSPQFMRPRRGLNQKSLRRSMCAARYRRIARSAPARPRRPAFWVGRRLMSHQDQ
jgi:hypothetical protein